MKHIMRQEGPAYGDALVPRQEGHRRHTGCIVTIVVLLALLIVLLTGGASIGFRLLNPLPIRTITEMHSFNLSSGAQPTLVVTNDDGLIHVEPGTSNTVTVTTTKVGDSFAASPEDFKVSYSQSGNTITIQINNNGIHPFDFLNTSRADVDVMVPARSNLRLQNNSGDVNVTGVQGQMTITTDSGMIQATDVSLMGDSQFSTDSGSIDINGSIDRTGRYTFQSTSGDIAVALPRSASFHAQLASNSGTITNDFPHAATQQPGSDSKTVSSDVGSSPQATVDIQSDSGNVSLRQQ